MLPASRATLAGVPILYPLSTFRTMPPRPDGLYIGKRAGRNRNGGEMKKLMYEPYGSRSSMRLSNAAHESRPWRIREIVPDFTLEDVWALPAHGGAEDFQTLLEVMTSGLPDPANWESLPTRVLWRVRDRLGSWFGLGRISAPINSGRDDAAGKLPIPGTDETSLTDRLPYDLRNTAADVHFDSVPFAPLYRTDIEFAEEMSNRTVHAVGHLAWVDQGEGRYQGQMAV